MGIVLCEQRNEVDAAAANHDEQRFVLLRASVRILAQLEGGWTPRTARVAQQRVDHLGVVVDVTRVCLRAFERMRIVCRTFAQRFVRFGRASCCLAQEQQ